MPKENVISRAAKKDKDLIQINFNASTLFTSRAINSSSSLSMRLLIMAEPAAENIKETIVKKIIFASGSDLEARTIPVSPVIPTLRTMFGLESEINALK